MKYPVNYIAITQKFGNHKGIDFGWNSKHGGEHQPIYAVDDGEVIYKSVQKTGGKVLHIKHSNGYVSEYGHLASWYVNKGDKVKKGHKIGTMGKSGIATGCHLHFGLYKGSKINYANKLNFVNPLKYLCKYDDQITNLKSKLLVKYKTKKVVKCDELNIRTKPNTNGKIVGKAKKGHQVESFGTKSGWNIVDNIRDYYCSNKYVK